MPEGIYLALSGAVAQEQALEIVSNNLSNASTTGFKQADLGFREALADAQQQSAGVSATRIVTDFGNGAIQKTGRALDVAQTGPGFFVVQTPNGARYTRSGALAVSADGVLGSLDGLPILGEGGAIRVDGPGELDIDHEGLVWQSNTFIGRLRTVEFNNPGRLVREGGNLFKASPGDAPVDVDTRVEPRALERSNVSPIRSMTELVMISRAHEMFHRAIETLRSIDQTATDKVA